MADVAWNGDAPSDWTLTMRESVLESMQTFSTSFDIIDDLKVRLIRNTTGNPFITSDDPAVLTNRWYCQNPKAKGLSGGVGNAGVLFFFPLTPQVNCVIYDGDVYSMPCEGGWMTADRVSDIEAFNQHQFLGCWANIYFADWSHRPLIEKAFEEVANQRPAFRHEVITAVLDSQDNWGKKYRVVPRSELNTEGEVLVHVKSVRPKPSGWPSLIKWRHKSRIYSNNSGTGFVRRSQTDQGAGYRRIS
jgi:hypothetical protein